MRNPFRYFNSSPEVIRLTVMMYILVFDCAAVIALFSYGERGQVDFGKTPPHARRKSPMASRLAASRAAKE